MTDPDVEAAEALKEFQARLEKLAANWLDEYCATLEKVDPGSIKSKHLNDPVWGTIAVSGLEVAIIDSPLIQRLRYLRQLGVVHWTFPGAVHTRFEHSIGAMHQASEVVNSINRTKILIPSEEATVIRIAALVHDVGHGAMSHVTEKAVEQYEEVEAVVFLFIDRLNNEEGSIKGDNEKNSLSEIAAYFIVGSPAFARLLKAAAYAANVTLPPNAVSQIKRAIVGRQLDPRRPMLHEIVSGPMDADKMDYMQRDAYMAGVPQVTDILRLRQKINARDVDEAHLPPRLKSQVQRGQGPFLIHGLDWSGASAYEELLLARALLFEKVYHHVKTRATESMVSSMVEALVSGMPTIDRMMVPYLVHDDDLLSGGAARVLGALGVAYETSCRQKVVEDLVGCLRNRRLFVRAFAFPHEIAEGPGSKAVASAYSDLMKNLSESRQARRDLEKEIVATMRQMAQLLEHPFLPGVEEGDRHFYIRIDSAKQPIGEGNMPHVFLFRGEELREHAPEQTGARGWSDAIASQRQVGFLFVPREVADLANLAAEYVLRTKHHLPFPRHAILLHAKVDKKRIEALRKSLADKGFYNTAPRDLRPYPARLDKADIPDTTRSIGEKLQGYEGPTEKPELEATDSTISEGRLVAWLSQFPGELIDDAIKMLRKVKLIGRQELVKSLSGGLEQAELIGKRYSVCSLGGPRDSSDIAKYWARDIVDKDPNAEVRRLEDAIKVGEPIVLVDDFVGTGHQTMSTLAQLLGRTPPKDLGEKHNPLPSDLADKLKGLPLHFVFSAGREKGRDDLQKYLKELGLNGTVFVGMPDKEGGVGNLPRLDHVNVSHEFLRFCESVGQSILAEEGRTAEWVRGKAMGYGNQAYLLIFPYNTPSATLTLLWKDGNFEGVPWQPLFPRLKK